MQVDRKKERVGPRTLSAVAEMRINTCRQKLIKDTQREIERERERMRDKCHGQCVG